MNLHPRNSLASIILIFASLAGSLQAAVVYNEFIDGDLPDLNPLTVIPLQPGINTIQGTFGAQGQGVDFDSFAFILPAGSDVISAMVELVDGDGDVINSTWRVGAGSGDLSGGVLVQNLFSSSPGTSSLVGLPLGPNTYNFTHSTFSAFVGPTVTADYTFTFELSGAITIPEPSSALLFGLGAFGMALRRRR